MLNRLFYCIKLNITKGKKLDTLSFVIPVYNEQDTIISLFEKIRNVIIKEKISRFEVIFIDDGSSDASWEKIEYLVNLYPEDIKAIQLRKNFGKTIALKAGFKAARGDIIFTLDADLQDDPEEIPNFLKKIDEGYDLVSGWKQKRSDPFNKTFPSKIFNKVTSWISGMKLNDFNSGYKAYRNEVLNSLSLHGEMHRYIPVLANDYGFKVTEIPVRHHSRKHGRSKYGFERYARGFLDLLTVLLVTRYLQRPGHLFGSIGILSGLFGGTILVYMTTLWFMNIRPIGTRPLFFLGILSVILSVQLISLGLLAELSVRNKDMRPVDSLIRKHIGKTRNSKLDNE